MSIEKQIKATEAGKYYHIFYPVSGYVTSHNTLQECVDYIAQDKKECLENDPDANESDWDDVVITKCTQWR